MWRRTNKHKEKRGRGGGGEEEGKKPDGIPSENSAAFTNLLAFSSARTNNLKRVKWKRFISREYLLAFSLFVMYLKRLSDDKVAVCMGGGWGGERGKANDEACRNGQHECQFTSFDKNGHY